MKRNSTCTLCAFVFTAFILLACKNQEQGIFDVSKPKKPDEVISIEDAKELMTYYRKNKEHFKVAYLKNGQKIVDTLEGFRLDTADINQILNYAPGKKASSIIVYFGRRADDTYEGSKKYPSYTLIAMPIGDNNTLVKQAYDKADPCPPYCPDTTSR